MANVEISRTACPERADLERLFNESEADSIQSQWEAHLETCALCQQTVQSLAASDESWIALARHLQMKEPAAPALVNVMAALKDGASLSSTASGQDRPLLDFLDPPEIPEQIGRLAHYDVAEVIGRGGMGVVLKAWDSALHRVVAIKVLAPRLAVNQAAQARFVREARAVAAIAHENVVAVHAVGETHALPYLVMQYIPGVSLQEHLGREGRLSVYEIVRIGMQTAAGLAAAHAQGLIHCDIKPDNLLLEAGSGRVKITDFGLARALDEAGNTDAETIAGTPRFMAPEQARGEALDPRTDLFSLGSVLYTLCTGQFPFQGKTNAEVLHQVVSQTPIAIATLQPGIPHRLIEIIERLHAKERGQRFASAVDVVNALEQVVANPADRWAFVPTVEGPKLDPKKPRRHVARIVAAALLLLLLGGLTVTEVTGITRLVATVLRIRTPQGILVVEVDDPETKVTLDGDTDEVVISSPGIHEFRLRPGKYLLRAARDGQTTRQEIITIRRGEKQAVTIRLEPAVATGKVEKKDSFGVVARLTGHQGPVRDLAVSRDGKWLLSCSGWPGGDRTIRLWDLASGKEVRRLGQHEDQVYAVAFSPDAARAASGGEDGAVRIWDVKTGKEAGKHLESRMPIHSVAFSPDGKTILAGSGDGTIRQWSVESGKLLRTFTGHSDAVGGVSFSKDGKRMASAGRDSTVRVWDVETGKEIHRLEGHEGWVSSVQFAPDGGTIAAASVNIYLWDARSGKLIRELKGHKFGTNTLAFSPDGRRIVSGGYDTTVRVWDAATGQQLHNFSDHRNWVWSVAFTPDGKHALSAGGGGRQNSEYVPGTDFAIRVWNLSEPPSKVETKESFGVAARLAGHQGPVRGLAVSRDGKWLLSCSGWPEGDRTIRLWDLASGKEVRRLGRHEDQVRAVAFSPDGALAVSGGEDGAVRIWNVKTGKEAGKHLESNKPINAVAFSPDGTTIVAGGGDGKIRHWSIESGQLLRTFTGHNNAVGSVAFSRDGKHLASGGRDRLVRVWDVETGKEIHRVEGHEGRVSSVQFSPDGHIIASGGVGIRLWDAASGKLIRELKGHKFGTNTLAFSPDGRSILSGGYEATVRMWDVASGRQFHSFADHREWVWSVAFTPDGKHALSAGGGGRQNSEYVPGTDFAIRVWKLPQARVE